MGDEVRENEQLAASYAVAEAIAAKDQNNLYVVSRYFADPEKYRAFCALYAVMRLVDDRIDEIPSRTTLTLEARAFEHGVVEFWERAVDVCRAGAAPVPAGVPEGMNIPDLLPAFADASRRFPVPGVLWRNFFNAMHQDLEGQRFATFRDFLDYAEGAAVAPTTIFLYLIASRSPASGGAYRLPEGFDLLGSGRHLGIFAYLGHILRDLAADLATGREGLLYLAADDLEAFGITEEMLFADLAKRQASPQLRALVDELVERARARLRHGRRLLQVLDGTLTSDCAFILELIVTLYQEVVDRIVACSCDPLAGRHHLSLGDKKRIAFRLAKQGGFFSAADQADPIEMDQS
ncbi:MAG: phytoene/squalene synthase family protein [Thermoanaerobaculia bacterium]